MSDQALDDLMALLLIEGPPAKEGQVAAYLRKQLQEIGVPSAQIVHDNAYPQSEYGREIGELDRCPRYPGCDHRCWAARCSYARRMDRPD